MSSKRPGGFNPFQSPAAPTTIAYGARADTLDTPITPEQKEDILKLLQAGEDLRIICDGIDMPPLRRVMGLIAKDPIFREKYYVARKAWAEAKLEEAIAVSNGEHWENEKDIKDKGAIARDTLRVNTLLRAATIASPDRFGAKPLLAGVGPDGLPEGTTDAEVARRVAELFATASVRAHMKADAPPQAPTISPAPAGIGKTDGTSKTSSA